MKIVRIIMLIALVPLVTFTMGANGCGPGAIQLAGQSDETSLEELWEQELQRYNMEMPVITVIDGRLRQSEDEDVVLKKCLMNYAPDETNFLTSIEMPSLRNSFNELGLLNSLNDDIKQQIEDLVIYVNEIVGFFLDSGQWALLVQLNDGVVMSDFASNYLADLVTTLNENIQEDEKRLVPAVLDDYTVIISPFEEVRKQAVLKVEEDRVEDECAFYRINKCSALNTRPMMYFVAKGRTALISEQLTNVVPDLKEDIQKSMAIIGVDTQDGVYRFYIGVLNGEDPLLADVTTYFSFYIDTNSFLWQLVLDRAADSLANRVN